MALYRTFPVAASKRKIYLSFSLIYVYLYIGLWNEVPSLLTAGDVPRVDGQLAVARAFGDKSLKIHLSSEPDVKVEMITDDTEFIILASDGIWKVR